MIHTICEHEKDVEFNQACILDECQSSIPLTFNEKVFKLNLSTFTPQQRSTLKLYTFWDLNYSAQDAMENAVELLNKDGGKNQYHKLSDQHRMIAYWNLVK